MNESNFVLFLNRFNVKNAESLRMVTEGVAGMDDKFSFDPNNITWKDYMMNVHFPGLMKYSIRESPIYIGSKM